MLNPVNPIKWGLIPGIIGFIIILIIMIILKFTVFSRDSKIWIAVVIIPCMGGLIIGSGMYQIIFRSRNPEVAFAADTMNLIRNSFPYRRRRRLI